MTTDKFHHLHNLYGALADGRLDALANLYHEDASLVRSPTDIASGQDAVLAAFEQKMAAMDPQNRLSCGDSVVIEAGDVALVLAKSYLAPANATGFCEAQRSIHVFRKDAFGQWRCLIDNFLGTDLLDCI